MSPVQFARCVNAFASQLSENHLTWDGITPTPPQISRRPKQDLKPRNYVSNGIWLDYNGRGSSKGGGALPEKVQLYALAV